jgi:hypothetical protein
MDSSRQTISPCTNSRTTDVWCSAEHLSVNGKLHAFQQVIEANLAASETNVWNFVTTLTDQLRQSLIYYSIIKVTSIWMNCTVWFRDCDVISWCMIVVVAFAEKVSSNLHFYAAATRWADKQVRLRILCIYVYSSSTLWTITCYHSLWHTYEWTHVRMRASPA